MKWMMPRSPSAIVAGGLCTGCGLCEALDSSGNCKMKIDTQGFLRPHGVESIAQADQQKIMNACPGVHVHPIHQDRASSHPRHPQWGDINQCLVGWLISPLMEKSIMSTERSISISPSGAILINAPAKPEAKVTSPPSQTKSIRRPSCCQ